MKMIYVHLKYLLLGIMLALMPNLDYHINLRGIHIYLGIPFEPVKLSIVSEIQHSADMLFVRSLADMPPPEPLQSISLSISFLWFLANVGIGYLLFWGIGSVLRLFAKGRPARPFTKASVQVTIIIFSLVTLLAFAEVFCLHYLASFRLFFHITLCVVLALLTALLPLLFFFCTNTFLHWGFRLVLCSAVHVYVLFFLVCYVFHAMYSFTRV